MLFANKEIAHKMIKKRSQQSENDFLTYCAMCRDNFASQGKQSYHLLDLIFPTRQQDVASKKGPGYSERQENRARLKRTLQKEVWGELADEEQCNVKLIISEKVRQVLEELMILDSDIIAVISHAEHTGNKFKDMENNSYIASFKPASVTYWVEYSPQEDGFLVHNAYSHRLEIKGS